MTEEFKMYAMCYLYYICAIGIIGYTMYSIAKLFA